MKIEHNNWVGHHDQGVEKGGTLAVGKPSMLDPPEMPCFDSRFPLGTAPGVAGGWKRHPNDSKVCTRTAREPRNLQSEAYAIVYFGEGMLSIHACVLLVWSMGENICQ